MWDLAKHESLEWAGKLEMQRRAGIKSPIQLYSLETDFLLEEPQCLLLKSSADWMRPTHITQGILLYLQSTDLGVNDISKIPDNNI